MNIPRTSAIAVLAGASLFAFGQSSGDRLVQLAKNPPKKMMLATSIGHKAGTDVVHLSIGIQPGDAAGLQSFADSVSDPKSPNYRHFISPAQVGARFGLPLTRIQRIQNYLSSQGIAVKLVAKNRLSILADATVSQAEGAFHTSIEQFAASGSPTLAKGTYFSFTTPPAVPASIAGDIVTVGGLESFTRPRHHTNSPLTPSQIRSVYTLASMYNNGMKGQGRTVAISSFDGFSLSNVGLECTQFGLPVPAAGAASNITVIPISGGEGQSLSASGEADLDIQATLGAAPLCNLLVYDNDVPGNQGNDPIGVYTQELNDNKADVITESYGWEFDSGTASVAHTLHLSMTAQGITYMAASGDSGTNLDGFTYPDIDPEVLSIGGTSVTVNSNGSRNTETGWASEGDAGSGGWVVDTADVFNIRPAWQLTPQFLAQPNVPSASKVPYHLYPDISLNSDPDTGYLIYVAGKEEQIGGTSGASPTCAGSWAVCEQQLIASGALSQDDNGHYRMGRLQDMIYGLNGDPTMIYDVTVGNNGILPNGQESNAGVGWDTDTGWGAPMFAAIVAHLSGTISLTSLTLNPTQVIGGQNSTGTVSISVPAPAGGQMVNLNSSVAAAQVPPTVTIAAGATKATFTVTTNSVSSTETATISASINGSQTSANLTLSTTQFEGFSLSSQTVVGGNPVTCTVNVNPAAGPGGFTLPISITGPGASAPATVTVPQGSKQATFTITTVGQSAVSIDTVVVGPPSNQATGTLTINPATFTSLSIAPSTVKSGTAATGTISLNGQAGPKGLTVTLSSNSSAATVPKSVVLASGASSATFSISTTAVTATKTATITAKTGSTSKTATLTVQANTVQSVTLTSSNVIGGSNATVNGTVTLVSPAPSAGVTVSLSSSSTKGATVPGSVKVLAGATSATFAVKHLVVTAVTTTTIKGTLNGASSTATLTVNPFQVSSLTLSPSTVAGGASSTGTVTLNATPGSSSGSGVKVTLTSSSSAAKPGASVTVGVGKTNATFTVKTTGVKTSTTATIKAATGSSSQTASLTITAPNLLAVTVAPGSVKGSASTHVAGSVTISSVAPPGGLVVNLMSSNTQAATVPATVTVAAGKTTATFTVTHKKVASSISSTITGSLAGATRTASITVTP